MIHILASIGWAAYLLVGFGVLCVGVFGISATQSERRAEAVKQAEIRKTYFSWHPKSQREFQMYRQLTRNQASWTVACAMFWPIGIPLYLAWKKGSFIDDALTKREEMLDAHRDSAG